MITLMILLFEDSFCSAWGLQAEGINGLDPFFWEMDLIILGFILFTIIYANIDNIINVISRKLKRKT